MDIFVSCDLTEEQIARVSALAGDDTLHLQSCFDASGPAAPRFARSEVVFGNVPPAWLTQSTALRWLQLESVGFGEYARLNRRALPDGLVITNLPDFFTEPVAESALAGILALYRGIDRLVTLQHDREWLGDPLRKELRTLAGAHIVMFGYGAINRRLAALIGPFGCQLTRFASDWQSADLDAALPSADIVISVAPETAATTAVFDDRRLGLMQHTALFVNFGRGSVVEEDALVERLRSARLGGAVIDVTLCEPLPRDHGLWACPNTLVTQHTGGGSGDEMDRKIEVFAANLARYRQGKPLAGVADLDRGY